ncbi:hypothetical protein GC101_00710 [Paenibacillus sp. LMG 31459]|uniref:LA2681-like HEPN domain-containing protein n=1 Tax=Paenibacillus phytohabitans TaxID=2654978 RepID=A0ABX1Y923_9BACL|nr:DUF5677 domain-containing protein [Paenibacillus phytohabitans]NOU77392.1 hypothetical protein [Paenibacillus phytohabitans]
MIKYPVDLSESWKEEIEKIEGVANADAKLLQRMIYILFIYDLMIYEVNENHKKYKSDKLIYISRYFLAHEYHLGESIYHLIIKGFGVSSSILVRSMLENLIDFSYLWLCKEINKSQNERDSWMDYEAITNESLFNRWNDFKDYMIKKGNKFNETLLFHGPTEPLINRAKNFKSQFYKYGNKYHWAKYPSLDQRARQVDMTGRLQKEMPDFYLEQEYIVNYKINSQMVHGESSMFSSYRDKNNNLLSIGTERDELNSTISMTSNYLLIFAYELIQINRLKIDIVEQLNHLGFR